MILFPIGVRLVSRRLIRRRVTDIGRNEVTLGNRAFPKSAAITLPAKTRLGESASRVNSFTARRKLDGYVVAGLLQDHGARNE